MKHDKLRKALDIIALKHAEGVVSNDVLIKACESYKIKTDFVENFDYDMLVAKSVFDTINGVEQDIEICKAIVPGQTKVLDGVMYVWTATPNAQSDYGWRVVKKGTPGTAPVGRGGKLNDTQVQAKQKFVNSLFPKDLSTLTVVKKLGGSTGAELVKDANGTHYVRKTVNGKLKNDHLEVEYLANQLYDILGTRVPDYELYDDKNGNKVLLSKFIPGLKQANKFGNAQECKALAQNAMVDVLMNNWDVYENDNSNYDTAGRIVRVDNGGSLDFRAQGGAKSFNGDILKTYHDMAHYNPTIFAQLSDDDILAQISKIEAKKDDIVNYLKQSNQPKYAQIFSQRIENLKDIKDEINRRKISANRVVKPRKLLPPDQMYRVFSNDEIDKIYKSINGSDYRAKIRYKDKLGWSFLSTVCKIRGFDARPNVVDENEYWNIVAKSKFPQCFRGVTDAAGNCTALYQIDHFKYSNDFFVGTQGIYGEGLYCHVNDGDKFGGTAEHTKSDYLKSSAYKHALQYAGGDGKNIMLFALENDFKMVTLDDIIKKTKQVAQEHISDKKTVDALKKTLEKTKAEIDKTQDDIKNFSDNLRKSIYQQMHYSEDDVQELQDTIDTIIQWGEVDPVTNEYTFPKFDKIVVNDFAKWVRNNGGTVEPKFGQMTFKLPNSRTSFTLHEYQFNQPSTIRRRNSLAPAYHIFAQRFEDWFLNEHVAKVQDAVQKAIENSDDKLEKLNDKLKKLKATWNLTKEKYDKVTTPDPEKDIYQAALAYGGKEPYGIIAALEGYDGIYVPRGNAGKNGFLVILNRSKVIVKK